MAGGFFDAPPAIILGVVAVDDHCLKIPEQLK
jgi:hypothetical protein